MTARGTAVATAIAAAEVSPSVAASASAVSRDVELTAVAEETAGSRVGAARGGGGDEKGGEEEEGGIRNTNASLPSLLLRSLWSLSFHSFENPVE